MSEPFRTTRRVTVRVQPVARLDVARVPPPSSGPKIVVAPPVARRVYGAPLPASGRFQRAGYRPGLTPLPDGPAEVDGFVSEEGIGETAGAARGLEYESFPDSPDGATILWDQPPQPPAPVPEVARWISDSSLLPTNEEYGELGAYVAYMLDGFAEFCQQPSVAESGQWQARMAMPPAVLPETVLDLQISSLHVKLRFETEHVVSRGVLERYAGQLQEQVITSLDDGRSVEVVLW